MKVYMVLLMVMVSLAAVTICHAQNQPAPKPPPLPIVAPRPVPMPVPRPPPVQPVPIPMPVIPKYPRPVPTYRFRRSPDDNKSPGGYKVDVYEQDRVGVVGKVQGRGTVWQSDDGKSRVEAHGQWSKVLDGPQRDKPHHNAGVSFSHDFGDD
nr:attacin-like c3021 [Carausius morosus]